MNIITGLVDGFQNLVANLGTSRDKAAANDYALIPLTQAQIETAWRTSPIAKKVIDMPAEDAGREWRDWQAEAGQITAIEAEEQRLAVQRSVIAALKAARAFGGAAIYIGARDTSPAKELLPETIGLGGLKYLTVLSCHQMTEGPLQLDPRLPGYNRPQYYSMNAGTAGAVQIHPSRLVIFNGEDAPAGSITTFGSWGDSVLQGNLEPIQRLDATLANIASLVFEAKIDVIKIKNFTENLRSSGAPYEALMLRRFRLAATAKGINGALLLDAEEEYEQKHASFATLPDIIDRFMQQVSAAGGVPMTLLFGTSPGGLNATGDSDTRAYYDRVKTMQSLDIGPAMRLLDECLIRSALGDRPEEIHYVWRPLWQPTAKEKADVGKISAETMKIALDMDAVSVEAAGSALVNVLTESGAFPGLEGYADEFPVVLHDPDEPQAALMPPGDPDAMEDDPEQIRDAAPRTLYVRRDVINTAAIVAWAKAQGFTDIVPDLHVTIAYSTTPVDWFAVGQSWSEQLEIAAGGPRQMERLGPEGRYIALLITANELVWRNREIRDAGASWDWPDYQPHISIQIGGDIDLSSVEPYRGKITLGPEIFEEVRSA